MARKWILSKGENVKMKIALYGIGGLYNYGCEAIVRGCTTIIKTMNPEAEINYYTPLEEDKKVVEKLDINVVLIPNTQKMYIRRAINKILRKINIPYSIRFPINKNVIAENDVIVSIGGDMYTIAKYLRDKGKYTYKNSLVDFGNKAIDNNKRIIIIGASIGPFGSYRKAVDYYSNHLKRCDLILCREEKSISYLKSIDVNKNVKLFPDPAFFVVNEKERKGNIYQEAKFIGINLSPLSFYEMQGGVTENTLDKLNNMINEIIKLTNLPIMLIPHVFNNKQNDNDYVFLSKLQENLTEDNKKYVKVVSPKNFIDVKYYLRQCQVLIAARMHCGVNAICEGIPTLFMAYSSKAIGMSEYIYNSTEYVLSLNELASTKFYHKIQELLSERHEIHHYLLKRVEDIRTECDKDDAFKIMKGMVTINEDS